MLSRRAWWILAAVGLVSCASIGPPSATQPTERTTAAPPVRSPFKEPPGVFSGDVAQANVATTICVPGWTATVRPSTSYTQALKRTMLIRVGIDPKDAIVYELDHFVPLAVGGHPRSEDNLWLQRWDGEWNARVKDRLERRLQVMVCSGQITLDSARAAIQADWRDAYRRYVAPDPSIVPRDMGIEEDDVVQ
jgi:hypothetical protein